MTVLLARRAVASADQNSDVRQAVTVRNVSKFFKSPQGSIVHALDNITLDFPAGSVTAIVGASGCGKSTLLRIIAGLETEHTGTASLDGAEITGPGLDRGIVFQDHRLLPWMTVEDNVALALHNLGARERNRVVEEKLSLVGLSGFKKSYPSQLSGGMAQRVAIARALAQKPKLLLLDEPFGALDAITRLEMQDELLAVQKHEGVTTILVTHDIEEALYLGDRIAVLSSRPGRLKALIDVNLSRPRSRGNADFAEMRLSLYEQFFRHGKDGH
ncbi:ABC transporter ATP-binding protein [Aureimonas fodinaquatilis]|uniref:ABC transporter ATP-binding protein n=1 Tax=Aureimonas fodinaquatilis TaxID=2565783 RepID=A0A5B0DWJ6_9HYPH|nr:ABC transporter ATP-binding protein [Aureimonas fodinaquatilis]KAA0970362.1 ABC transporter ATP-binding protein [Aureimonas fodinaquatilis]